MWKDWLSFSRNEQHGILVLLSFVLLLVLLRLALPLFFDNKAVLTYDYCEKALVIEEPVAAETEKDAYLPEDHNHFTPFNPNHISVSQLQSMGVPSAVIVNWIKYLEAGGRFFSGGEIKKIYGLDSLLAVQLIQYADCNLNSMNGFSGMRGGGDHFQGSRVDGPGTMNKDSTIRTQTASRFRKETGRQMYISEADPEIPDRILEINSSTAEEFMKLRGVGPVLSQRMVDFRNALGGYASVAQIKEVYGVSVELYNQILNYLSVDVSLVEGLDVNHSSVRRLKAHPYIDFYQARDIVECRNKKDSGMSLVDLKQLPSFDKDQINRLIPYFKFYPDSVAQRLNHSE